MNDPLDELTVFHGEASTTLARVYARLPPSEATAGCELSGRVVGPNCRWAQTLPAATSLVTRPPRSQADALLAEVIVPDPCFWSDELPMLYTVEVQLRRDGQVIAAAQRPIGFRGIGRRGRSLYQQGRRWVPRGMLAMSVASDQRDDLTAWRAAPAVMFAQRPSDALCIAASEQGVWLMADVEGETGIEGGDALDAELSRLARYAAVFLAMLPMGLPATREMRLAAPNLLLAQRPAVAQTPEPSPHADCLVLDATDAEAFAAAARETTLPIIAHRPLDAIRTLSEARRACDALQRDLARFGDYGGYVV